MRLPSASSTTRIAAFATSLVVASGAALRAQTCDPTEASPVASVGETVGSLDEACAPTSDTDLAFDAELAATDLAQAPESFDMTAVPPFQRAVVGYLLERRTDGRPIVRAELLAAGPRGRAVLAALLRGRGTESGIEFPLVRRALHRFARCRRGVPATLESFRRSVVDYTVHPSTIVESRPKRGPRRIYRIPGSTVSVAETLVDGEVRETEILVAGSRRDGSLGFLVYDANGRLVDTSLFPSPAGAHEIPVPYACLSCHFDATTMRFDVVDPSRR